MQILRYRYEVDPAKMLIGVLMLAALGGFMAVLAMNNTRGLVFSGIIHFSPNGATIFYWFMALACGFLMLINILPVIGSIAIRKELILTETALTVPAMIIPGMSTVLKISDITGLTAGGSGRQRTFHVSHRDGSVTIYESMMPYSAAFEELGNELANRVRGAAA